MFISLMCQYISTSKGYPQVTGIKYINVNVHNGNYVYNWNFIFTDVLEYMLLPQ
jgi:hypothetical protein